MLPKKSAICRQFRKCGKPGCKCNSGELHGPYFFYFYREDGKLKKSYIRKAQADELWQSYSRRRQIEQHYADERKKYTDMRRQLRNIDRLLAELKSIVGDRR